MSYVVYVCGNGEDFGDLSRRGAKRIWRDFRRIERRLDRLKAPKPFGLEFCDAMGDWMLLHREIAERVVHGIVHVAGGAIPWGDAAGTSKKVPRT